LTCRTGTWSKTRRGCQPVATGWGME